MCEEPWRNFLSVPLHFIVAFAESGCVVAFPAIRIHSIRSRYIFAVFRSQFGDKCPKSDGVWFAVHC